MCPKKRETEDRGGNRMIQDNRMMKVIAEQSSRRCRGLSPANKAEAAVVRYNAYQNQKHPPAGR